MPGYPIDYTWLSSRFEPQLFSRICMFWNMLVFHGPRHWFMRTLSTIASIHVPGVFRKIVRGRGRVYAHTTIPQLPPRDRVHAAFVKDRRSANEITVAGGICPDQTTVCAGTLSMNLHVSRIFQSNLNLTYCPIYISGEIRSNILPAYIYK